MWGAPTRRQRTLSVALAGALLMVAAAVGPVAQAGRIVIRVPDPERNSTVQTAWGWHTDVTPASITAFVNRGYRIIDLEVRSSSPRFSVAYVRDRGIYDRTWWWYFNQTEAQVNARLAEHNARLIDIEPYRVGGSLRFAAVMVRNTGVAQKQWQWWFNQTPGSIGAKAAAFGGRPVDIDRYAVGASSRFAVILIKNQGPDDKAWAHLYNTTPAAIGDYAADHDMRVIDLEHVSGGRFDAVLQGHGSEGWWWWFGGSPTTINNVAAQTGSRVYRIEPYGSVYAALLIDDTNAETRRIRNLVDQDLDGAVWGFYLKAVGGGTVVDLNSNRVWEPASAIKAVHAVHALREVRKRAIGLTSDLTWYAHPDHPARYPGIAGYSDDKNHCAYADDGDPLTDVTYSDDLGPVIIKNMLEQSDNRATDAIVLKWGFAALNATIDLIGMTRSHLYHRIGCDGDSSPAGFHRNELTARDISRLYEKVQDGTLLGTGSLRDTFWQYMAGGTIGSGPLQTMIRDEAEAAGLSGADANDFVGRIRAYSKGGSYGLCPDEGACNPPVIEVRTVGGIIYLPFKTTRGIVSKAYVYSRFLDRWRSDSCTFAQLDAGRCPAWENTADALSTLAVEVYRKIVRDALATW